MGSCLWACNVCESAWYVACFITGLLLVTGPKVNNEKWLREKRKIFKQGCECHSGGDPVYETDETTIRTISFIRFECFYLEQEIRITVKKKHLCCFGSFNNKTWKGSLQLFHPQIWADYKQDSKWRRVSNTKHVFNFFIFSEKTKTAKTLDEHFTYAISRMTSPTC